MDIPFLSLPITERLADEKLSLPMSPVLSIKDAKYVIDILNKFV